MTHASEKTRKRFDGVKALTQRSLATSVQAEPRPELHCPENPLAALSRMTLSVTSGNDFPA